MLKTGKCFDQTIFLRLVLLKVEFIDELRTEISFVLKRKTNN